MNRCRWFSDVEWAGRRTERLGALATRPQVDRRRGGLEVGRQVGQPGVVWWRGGGGERQAGHQEQRQARRRAPGHSVGQGAVLREPGASLRAAGVPPLAAPSAPGVRVPGPPARPLPPLRACVAVARASSGPPTRQTLHAHAAWSAAALLALRATPAAWISST